MLKKNPNVLLTFEEVHNPLRLPREAASEPPKVARTCVVLSILTSKCASCHHCVHFLDISSGKSGPLVCFVHFDLEMCFGPQRRPLFRHVNVQKWSGPVVFCTILYFLTSKRASRHNGVQFFISHLASFSEPQINGKTQCFATFLPFRASASSFFSYRLSSTLLFSLPLPSSAFFICPYCLKFDF